MAREEACTKCRLTSISGPVLTYCRGRWFDRFIRRFLMRVACPSGEHIHATCIWCGHDSVRPVLKEAA